MLCRNLFLRSCSTYHLPVRGLESHPFDHDKYSDRNPAIKPDKLRITIPVPVQSRALKRHRNPKTISKELDKEKMRSKKLIISTKRTELNHRMAQTYGKFEDLKLVSGGWYHRKSIGDYFTINPFMPPPATNFDDSHPTFDIYPLNPRLIEALAKCGFHKSTNIQHEAIPKMLEYTDSNTIIAAETGNGKTLAFLIPMLNQILKFKEIEENENVKNSPYGVIVTPGRELAEQIGGVAENLCSFLGLKVRVHLGGQIRKQILNGPKETVDIIVGSQGALSKLFHENYLKRDRTSIIALDEIDTLLDDTFKDDLFLFLRKFGLTGQSVATGITVLMAGATFPTNFEKYLSTVMDVEDMLRVSTKNIHRVLYHVPQKFLRVSASKKPEILRDIIEKEASKNKKVIVFSNKAATSDFVQIFLNKNNIDCVNFNGAHHYKYRRETLDKFMSGEVNVMSCTDLVSRGLDTSSVSHVINYDFPLNPADYIHRVGRVGRVNGVKNGRVTSLVDTTTGIKVLQNIETAVRKNIEISKVNNNIIRIIQHRYEKGEQRINV